jgi:hypothetical protein
MDGAIHYGLLRKEVYCFAKLNTILILHIAYQIKKAERYEPLRCFM